MNNLSIEKEAQAIFLSALELPIEKRYDFLFLKCGNNTKLLNYCKRLIDALNDQVDTMELLYGQRKNKEQNDPFVNSIINSYQIIKKIGQGGMASVYLAERLDGVHEKLVALKVFRNSNSQNNLIKQFHNERVILANLSHPNISRLLDGGNTSDGMPYFIMEFVDGIRIDEYCRKNELGVDEIIQIFSKICLAVEFAHKNLIIHRDIKPSNILVDANGEPHLLDFGIAKVLNQNNDSDTVTLLALTANYASPEQLLGKPLTTSTDIYSLGTLLYELLCGALPNDRSSLGSLFHSSNKSESTATSPSRSIELRLSDNKLTKKELLLLRDRQKRIRGDIDSVLLKALEIEPEDRYESVKDFSDDLKRYLSKHPVKAKNNTLRYRTQRFIQRNRISVFVTMLATLLLISSFSIQQFRIINERDNALIERDKATETKNFIMGLFESANPQEAMNSNISAKTIVDRGVEKLKTSFEAQPFVKAEILHTLGKIYLELSVFDTAEELLDESLSIYSDNGRPFSIAAAEVLLDQAIVYYRTSRIDKAQSTLKLVLMTFEKGDTENLSKAGETLYWLGYALQSNNNFEEALETQNKSLAYYKQAYGTDHPKVAESLTAIANVYLILGDYDAYLETNLEALLIRKKHLEEDHPQLGQSYYYVGDGYRIVRDFSKSLVHLNEAVRIWQQAYLDNHIRLFLAYHKRASTLNNLFEFTEALASLDQAESLLDSLGLNHYAMVSALRGIVYEDMGDLENARIYKEIALQQDIEKHGENSTITGRNYNNVGIIYGKLGQTKKAVEFIEKSLQINRTVYGEVSAKVANNYDSLGSVYLNAGLYEQSIEHYEKAMGYFIELFGEGHPGVETAMKGLKLARSRSGK